MGNRILVVEDDYDDLNLTVLALERAGLGENVQVARDGQQAAEILGLCASSTSRQMPDLVLLDLKMPIMDGPTLLRLIRENSTTKDLKVLILANRPHIPLVDAADLLEQEKFVMKPTGYREYLQAVGDATRAALNIAVEPSPPTSSTN
jgi:CheY-like chemotaxis protein